MAVQSTTLETTFNAMRERALRLEREAAALRSDLDDMAILVSWQTNHSVSPEALQRLTVSDTELVAYRRLLGAQFPDELLRLVIQAQQAATQLKHSLPQADRAAAIDAVIAALQQLATQQGLTVSDELEAAIGD
jgi:hypothetical protein